MMRPTINEESDCLRKKICVDVVDLKLSNIMYTNIEMDLKFVRQIVNVPLE